jgi:hypothetical protein
VKDQEMRPGQWQQYATECAGRALENLSETTKTIESDSFSILGACHTIARRASGGHAAIGEIEAAHALCTAVHMRSNLMPITALADSIKSALETFLTSMRSEIEEHARRAAWQAANIAWVHGGQEASDAEVDWQRAWQDQADAR